MISKILGTLAVWIIVLLLLTVFMIFLGGACWVALSIWKAIFAFFA